MTPRVVVVGASLAGLRAAEGLRAQGFDGTITVGGRGHAPVRPPAAVQADPGGPGRPSGPPGRVGRRWPRRPGPGLAAGAAGHRPRPRAAGHAGRQERLGYDGLVIATGSAPASCRAPRPWPAPTPCARWTTARPSDRPRAGPGRVVVVGGGLHRLRGGRHLPHPGPRGHGAGGATGAAGASAGGGDGRGHGRAAPRPRRRGPPEHRGGRLRGGRRRPRRADPPGRR